MTLRRPVEAADMGSFCPEFRTTFGVRNKSPGAVIADGALSRRLLKTSRMARGRGWRWVQHWVHGRCGTGEFCFGGEAARRCSHHLCRRRKGPDSTGRTCGRPCQSPVRSWRGNNTRQPRRRPA